ncbi:MAG: DUF1353 domain-containing protein [Asticcacaulis sp.]
MSSKFLWALIGGAMILSGCAERVETVYVPAPVLVQPTSLTQQPVILFNKTKNGRKLFTLEDEFPYCDAETGLVVVVPKWYVTDFASVPWYGQAVIDPQGPTARAAIIHDWLYTIGQPGKREIVDAIFYRAMIKFGVSDMQARIAYNAVRVGGEHGYGLAGDWLFIDPRRPDVTQPPPFTKPKVGGIMYMKNCQGFEAMIASGWKAYPRQAPALAASATPAAETEAGFVDGRQTVRR